MPQSRIERRFAAMMRDRQLLLDTLENTDLAAVVRDFLEKRQLPELAYHFTQHAEELMCDTIVEYEASMVRHLAKSFVEMFIRRRKQGDVMWYAVDRDSGEVVQYNQSRNCLWTYYRSADVGQQVSSPDMVRIVRTTAGWRLGEHRVER